MPAASLKESRVHETITRRYLMPVVGYFGMISGVKCRTYTALPLVAAVRGECISKYESITLSPAAAITIINQNPTVT